MIRQDRGYNTISNIATFKITAKTCLKKVLLKKVARNTGEYNKNAVNKAKARIKLRMTFPFVSLKNSPIFIFFSFFLI